MQELRKKLASLREQWEAEKLGMGDVQQMHARREQVELEFEQLSTADQGEAIVRHAGQRGRLSEALRAGHGAQEARQAPGDRRSDAARGGQAAAAAPRSRPRRDRRGRQRLDRHSRQPHAGDRKGQAAGDGRAAAPARRRPGRSGRRRRQRRPPQPQRPARPEPSDRLVPVPRPHRRRQDRAVQGPGRGACSTTRTPWSAST